MNIDSMQIFIQAVNFFAVMGALSYLLYKPVLKVLDERAKRIQEGNAAAETAIKQREAIDEMKAKAKKEIDKEKATALKKATQEARSSADKIIEQAQLEAKEIVANARKEAAQEKKRTLNTMKSDITDIVQKITEAILPKQLDAKTQQSLIDGELETILKSI